MNDCIDVEIRDLLPELVHRRLADGDRARVTEHVGGCVDCQVELALLRSAVVALHARPAVDVAAIVRALPAPPTVAGATPRLVLETDAGTIERPVAPRRAPRRRLLAGLGVGAAAAAAMMATLVARYPAPTGAPAPAAAVGVVAQAPAEGSAPRGADRSRIAAEPRLGAEAEPVQLALSLASGSEELSDGELEALLGDLESMDAMPRLEPDEATDPLREDGEEFQ